MSIYKSIFGNKNGIIIFQRFPRSASPDDKKKPGDNGQISIHGKKEGGKITWTAEGRKDIWKNDHGSIWVSGGANKQPHQKTQGQVGIGGSFTWG